MPTKATLALILKDTSLDAVYELKRTIDAVPTVEHSEILDLSSSENLEQALTRVVNQYSQDSASNTPDSLLASYLMGCLQNWQKHALLRDRAAALK